MTWISLICLFALSSTAFGRTTYSYGSGAPTTQFESTGSMRDAISQQFPSVQSGYGQPQTSSSSFSSQQDLPRQTVSSGYGSSFSTQQVPQTFSEQRMLQSDQLSSVPQPQPTGLPLRGYGAAQTGYDNRPTQQFEQKVEQEVILTPADILCRGQQPETVIPIEDSRRYVVCLAESKGVIQACPAGLLYHTDSRRCERKLGPLENPCAKQPCLNGGQCSVLPDLSSFQCQCAPGFDGKVCELDGRACQTQQPCGQTPDARCQSFRLGAALQYICILQNGAAYGLDARQVQPSPCRDIDGAQPLAVSDKGFIMCDGPFMFIESCPGGTIWDDLNKACVWPDKQGTPIMTSDQPQRQSGYGQQSSYGSQTQQLEQPRMTSSYGSQIRQLEQPRMTSSYGGQIQQLEQPRMTSSSFGSQVPQFEQSRMTSSYGSQLPQLEQTRLTSSSSSYGSQVPQLEQPRMTSSFGTQVPQFEQSRMTSSYGSQLPQLEQTRLTSSSSYGSQVPQLEQPRMTSSFGSQIQQLEQPKMTSSYGSQLPQRDLGTFQQTEASSYGSQQPIVKPQIWQQTAPRQQDVFTAPKQSSGY